MGAVRLVTKSEYARMRGVSEAAVRKAVKDGRITLIDGNIDPAVADIQWQQNSRPRIGSKKSAARAHAAGEPASGASAHAFADEEGNVGPSEDGPPPGGHFDYETARAKREHHEAMLAEMRYRERSQQLCETARVKLAIGDIMRVFVDGLERIPDRVSAQIHSGMTQAEINAQLERELRAVREDLQAAISSLPQRLHPVDG